MKRIARVEFSGSKDYILPEGDINSAHQAALMKFHDDFPVNKYHLVDVNNVWIAEFPDEQNPDTILEEVFKIANNAIYFRDKSDYLTALNEICNAIHPDDEMVGEILIESTTPR